jgi:hypothetical protein
MYRVQRIPDKKLCDTAGFCSNYDCQELVKSFSLLSSYVAVLHVHCFFFLRCHRAGSEKSFVANVGKWLQEHIKCLKQFMGMKLYLVCMSSNGPIYGP